MGLQDTTSARRFYDRISGVYDALADADEHAARELGLKQLAPQPGEHVLEVGFGTGSAIAAIAREVGVTGQVVGLDISEGMREVAARRLESSGLAGVVELRVAVVPPIPAADNSFDAAFMAFTLELFPDDGIPDLLEEIRRVLKPGGRLVVVAMDEGTEAQQRRFAERAYTWLHRHFPHIVDCRPIDAAGILRRAGYSIDREETLEIWGLPVKVCRAVPQPRGR